MSGLTLDVGQANEIKLAAQRAGWTNDDLKILSEGNMMERLLPIVRGEVEVVHIIHTIDCDANPYVPDGWEVEEHIKGGKLPWKPEEVSLHLCNEQKDGSIEGKQLREKLKGKSVQNACVLDYLLANPRLIPEEWKGNMVFFWGTIYRDSDDYLYVRCLFWRDDRWYWDYYRRDSRFYDHSPALLSCK